MKHSIFICAIIVLAACTARHKKITGDTTIRYDYTYQCKAKSWSDISILYQADTGKSVAPFMQRPGLQYIMSSFRCNIHKTILQQNADSQLVAFEITEPAFTATNNSLPIQTKKIESELTGNPFYAVITANGLVKSVNTAGSISQVAATIIKNIAGQQQFAVQPNADTTWTLTEENNNGAYLAQYQKLPVSDGKQQYVKRNRGYTSIKTNVRNAHIYGDSKMLIATGATGKVETINGSEDAILLSGKDTISISTTDIKWEYTGQTEMPSTKSTELVQLVYSEKYDGFEALNTALSDEKIKRITYTHTLGSDTWNTLSKRLQEQAGQSEEIDDSLFLKCRALAYVHPGSIDNMNKVLLTAPYGSPLYKILTKVLANTGNTYATDAMASYIILHKQQEDVLLDILPAVATSVQPTEKMCTALKSLCMDTTLNSNIVYTAQLSMGGLLQRMYKTDSAAADKWMYFITNDLHFGADTVQQLLVLGNTGSAKALPLIKQLINDATVSKQVKEQAITALRFIATAEVNQLLNNIATQKNTEASKIAAAVIAFRQQNQAGT